MRGEGEDRGREVSEEMGIDFSLTSPSYPLTPPTDSTHLVFSATGFKVDSQCTTASH